MVRTIACEVPVGPHRRAWEENEFYPKKNEPRERAALAAVRPGKPARFNLAICILRWCEQASHYSNGATYPELYAVPVCTEQSECLFGRGRQSVARAVLALAVPLPHAEHALVFVGVVVHMHHDG